MSRTICFFGIYNPDYSRNLVLTKGFQANGFTVLNCRVDPKRYPGLIKYWQLFKIWRNLEVKPDLVLVAWPGHSLGWFARLLFPRPLIIFDAFTSLFDSNVIDRQLYSRYSWRAFRDYWLDWFSLHLADVIITDTLENAKYLAKQFNISIKKINRIFVGTSIVPNVSPVILAKDKKTFSVHFHGTFIPLQGIEWIIRSAKLLEKEPDLKFRIIGSGQESAKITALVADLRPTNIEFLPRQSFAELVEKITEADLVLGIFGTSDKASRVIPNKVFEGLALAKPVLTADTPAVRELLTDHENVLFSKTGDSVDLATKILALKNNLPEQEQLIAGAKYLVQSKLNPQQLVAEFLAKIENENRSRYS